ncbi:MAG: aspartoacylase [Flavobacteriaceae bacterium]|nr:aspartoacylase [Flavobacteriaceae bacterium]
MSLFLTMNNTQTEQVHTKNRFKRIIGTFKGNNSGPTLVFIGGIHGNESSGVLALERVLESLQGKEAEFSGKIIALAGNLKALQHKVRFISTDLNRLFTIDKVNEIRTGKQQTLEDEKEQISLLKELDRIILTEKEPLYFFDLHTTSSKTEPFLTINDTLLNRSFTKNYPLPIVLGIEEYLEGPLLSYINELGYVAFGFEAGQHTSKKALANHISFIYVSFMIAGSFSESDKNCKLHFYKLLKATIQKDKFYEIIYRFKIEEKASFKMHAGFENFQKFDKNRVLAENNYQEIYSPYSGSIFMPLYQGKGNDGFFVIRKIPKVFLTLSKWLRNVKLDHLLVLLPGVNWQNKNKEAMVINLTVARFFTKQFFHLLGYRSKRKDSKQLIMKNRERASKTEMYKSSRWFNK